MSLGKQPTCSRFVIKLISCNVCTGLPARRRNPAVPNQILSRSILSSLTSTGLQLGQPREGFYPKSLPAQRWTVISSISPHLGQKAFKVCPWVRGCRPCEGRTVGCRCLPALPGQHVLCPERQRLLHLPLGLRRHGPAGWLRRGADGHGGAARHRRGGGGQASAHRTLRALKFRKSQARYLRKKNGTGF